PYDDVAGLGVKQTGTGGDIAGEASFTGVTLVTRSTTSLGWQITASTSNGDPYAAGLSTGIQVQAGAVQRLLVLAPGEVSEEGNPIGKSNPNPNYEAAGTTFTVSVRAVDANFNIVPSTNPLVALTFVGNSDSTLDDSYAQ